MIELCAIVRDEDDYLDEWIQHHLSIGFDRIVLYNNHSINRPQERENVIVRDWTETYKQPECYTHHCRKTDAEWVACIDLDEFIILKEHKTIQELLADKKEGVYLHWVCYGAEGQWIKKNGKVMDRFKTPSSYPISDHYKSIVKTKNFRHFLDPHSHMCLNGKPKSIPLTTANINHYVTKSFEEFCVRISKGRVDVNQKKQAVEFFRFNPEMKPDNITTDDVWK